MRDEDGQAPRQFRAAAVMERQIDELIGLCRGVLADGDLSQGEAEFLLDWMDRHRQVANRWPANVLYRRLATALADGVMDAEEERDLLGLLMDATGIPVSDGDAESMSTGLPLTAPPPQVVFAGRTFCFTGKFYSGSRRQVEGIAAALGAEFANNPSRSTDYLVIGAAGSRDWIHSTYGRKIEHAVELREAGHPIAIIAEEVWVDAASAGVPGVHLPSRQSP